MRAECIQAVANVLQRPITVAEARNIEERIKENMRTLARDDPAQWQSLSTDQRLMEASKLAARQIVEEAKLRKDRLIRTVQAHDRIAGYLENQKLAGIDKDGLESLLRVLAPKNDGKNNVQSVESQIKGTVASAVSQLVDAFELIHPKFLGLLRDKGIEEAMVRTFHGDKINDPRLVKAAAAWEEVTTQLRTRFNSAGGQIRKLENWGMPHSWAPHLVTKAGQDAWVAQMTDWVDRSKYVKDDGTPFSDLEMQLFLKDAWLTIATDGATKVDANNPKAVGGNIKANRHSYARELHFVDGQAAYEAFKQYSDKNLGEVLLSHVRAMAKDVAIIETFGPNADFMMRHFLDREYKSAAVTNPSAEAKIASRVEDLEHLYNYLAGNSPAPIQSWLATASEDLRNILTASMLGSAPITSITDEGTMYLTAHVNKLPMFQLFMNELQAMNPANRNERRVAERMGLMVHTLSDSVRRFAAENAGPRMSSRVASFSMRVSGLSAWTNARRRAFSVTMMDAIGSTVGRYEKWDQIPAEDAQLLSSKGVTPEDFTIWKLAKPQSFGGNHTVLTPEAIMRSSEPSLIARQQAAAKLMGVVLEEQDVAVIEPGARERAMMSAGTRAGTLKGEITRSFFLFKSFPIAMMHKHWERGLGMYETVPGKVGYLSSLIAAQTLLGAVAMEINDMLGGKNPRELVPGTDHWKRNWVAAFLKGGALGLYGDFLFNESTANDRSFVASLMGPVAGLVEGVDDLGRGNLIQYMDDRPTNLGAEAVRFVRGITPGSNLWYAKAALDHMIFQQLQEYYSPGYLGRIRNRAYKTQGTSYWWEPGQDFSRAEAPDLSTIAGR